MSRKPRKPRDPNVFDIAAGRRMADLFDRARAEFGLSTDGELWKKLGVGRDTAQSWMRGERPPSRALGSEVAARLGIRYDDLLAVYEGREPEDMDAATVIAALEWAIRLVRAGQAPPSVEEDVRAARDELRRRRSSPVRGLPAPTPAQERSSD